MGPPGLEARKIWGGGGKGWLRKGRKPSPFLPHPPYLLCLTWEALSRVKLGGEEELAGGEGQGG